MPWFSEGLAELGKTSRGGALADAKRAVSLAKSWGIHDKEFHTFVQVFAKTKSWKAAEDASGIDRATVRARCDVESPLYDGDVAELLQYAEQGHLADAEDVLWGAVIDGDPKVAWQVLTSRNPARWDQGGRMKLAKARQEERQKEVLTNAAAAALVRTGLETVLAGIQAREEREMRNVTPAKQVASG